MFCGEVLCSIHNSSRRPLCAPILVVRTLPENARKRTGSFSPVMSTADVQSWVEGGRFERDLKCGDVNLAA